MRQLLAAVAPAEAHRLDRPRRLISTALLTAYACSAAAALHAEQPTSSGGAARVVAVVDGDTLVVGGGSGREKIRLFGVDAPESGQRHGRPARDALASLTLGQAVTVLVVGPDRHGRAVARVFRDGTDVNLAMVRSGWAWHSSRHDPRAELREAQATARRGRRGLWASGAPEPPWAWRRSHASAGRPRLSLGWTVSECRSLSHRNHDGVAVPSATSTAYAEAGSEIARDLTRHGPGGRTPVSSLQVEPHPPRTAR
jgi:endonuclease YncB( thermonuclease family)